MKTRIIQTRFWDDDVVQSVSKDAKLLWLFLLTNKDLGMTNYVRIPDVFKIAYTLLTPSELKSAKEELETTGRIYFYQDWIFLPNLEEQNRYKNASSNIKSYEKELSNVPSEIKEYFTSIDTSVDSTVHSTQKPKIRNKKPKIRNQKQRAREEKINLLDPQQNEYHPKNHVNDQDFEEISHKYDVPIAFVKSKFDDVVNWYEEKPNDKNRKNRTWRRTLMRWTKDEAIKIRKGVSKNATKNTAKFGVAQAYD